MMEVKVWAVVCVLLLANRGPAAHGDGHAATSTSSSSSVLKVTAGASSLAPDPTTAAALNRSDMSPTVPSDPSNDTGAGNGPVKGALSPSQSTDSKSNQTHQLTSLSPDQSPTPQLHASSTTLSPGGTSPANGSLATTSATSVTHPDQVMHPTTSPLKSVPQITTSAPQTSQFTNTSTSTTGTTSITSITGTTGTTGTTSTTSITSTTGTTSITGTTGTTGTGAPQGSASSASTAITSPKHTQQPDAHPGTSSTTQRAAAATTASSTLANSPSQLNVKGDTIVLHQTPALDPLLAGLVSAFIITAVIISLLLFLKLRRRNSRPEFRRLQDLPMDDMEDTPLSMYSY